MTSQDLVSGSLCGTVLTGVKKPVSGVWALEFGSGSLNIECPWRIVHDGSVLLGSVDDGQKFGLPVPVDGALELFRILNGKIVEAVEINRIADLRVVFDGNTLLEAFNHSSGYEGWNYIDRSGLQVIALGGGDVAIWGKVTE